MSERAERDRGRGQALVEFALVFPIAALLIFGVIVLGLLVFFQFEVTNVAREAARYAAIHSSTATCSTTSWRDPATRVFTYQPYPYQCDGPNNPNDTIPWPRMTAFARASGWGLNPNTLFINACWSGYVSHTIPTTGYASYADPFPQADSPPVDNSTTPPTPNQFIQCTIAGVNPVTNISSLGCGLRMTSAADDPASDLAGNYVTAYACYQWTPPLAGFLMIPPTVTFRAAITEVIQRQQ